MGIKIRMDLSKRIAKTDAEVRETLENGREYHIQYRQK